MPDRTRHLLLMLLLALACAFFISSLAAAGADASYTSKVTVVTHELHAGECLDGCNRPELRVVAVIDTNDGRPARTCIGPTNGSLYNVVEDQTICNGVSITGDFTVRLTLMDVDACEPGAGGCTEWIDAADLTAGPGQAWEAGPFGAGTPAGSRVTTSGGPSWIAFTVSAEPVDTSIVITAPDPMFTFDPTLGRRVDLRANLSQPTRIEYSVTSRSNPDRRHVLHAGPAWNPSVHLDWDGKLPGSFVPAPDDVYDLELRDLAHRGPGPAASASTPVRIQRTPQTVVDVALDPLAPAATWDFRNGPITARGTTTANGSLRLQVAPRPATDCPDFGTPIWEGAAVQRARGPFELAWDGHDGAGQPVAPGVYCLRATLTADGITARSAPRRVIVRPPSPGLEAWALPDPIVPIRAGPGAPAASIEARVVDTAHATRYAARVTVEVSPAGPPGQPVALAPRTVATCERATTCGGALPADLAAARAIAYRVTATEAADAPGGPATTTSAWRITDLNPLPLRTWRASVPAIVDAGGMITTPPVSTTLDVVYYPGSGNDLQVPAQAARFASRVAGNIEHLWGLGPERGPTTFAMSSAAVSFIVSPQDVVDVRGTGPQMCAWSGLVPVSYADAHGILHDAGCRDVSYSRSREYSSLDPTVDWHELHHALYNLDDEYCCDGGYDDGVNAYWSEASCTAKSSPGAVCTRVIDGLTRRPATEAQTSVWRGDPLPDVMVFNELVENADDLRAAAATFARCGSGRC